MSEARRFWVIAAIGGLVLSLPAILNGAPFLYIDSATYIAQGQAAVSVVFPGHDMGIATLPQGEEIAGQLAESAPGSTPSAPLVVGGRSIYYGVLAYLSQGLTASWALVFLQGLAVSVPAVSLFRAVLCASWPVASLLSLALLAFATPLGLFVGMIMPDIWVGAMVLSVAALAVGAEAGGPAFKAILFFVCILAVLFHLSHLVLVTGILALFLLAQLCVPWFRKTVGIGWSVGLCGIILAGIGGQVMFSKVVERVYGAAPISRPHLTAHLVDLGPGQDYAETACAGPERSDALAICPYVDRLPLAWTRFLFLDDPEAGVFAIMSDAEKRRMAEEDMTFAVQTFLHAPWVTAIGLARDGLVQIRELSLDDAVLVAGGDVPGGLLATGLPADLRDATRTSFLYGKGDLLRTATDVTQIGTAAAALLLLVSLVAIPAGAGDRPADPRIVILLLIVGICLLGVILNAAVCGILASPYGRFQARIAWIVPFLALLSTIRVFAPSHRYEARPT
ncbi:hypothetical protein [Palleronia aestuarii]|uniref:hypothetical protein n=1 Tax=Palleronia aestuarii TaxID=568105 RepID=UPI000DAD1F8C|nr:hypothetical protein [Palleronia aestuarii]